MPTQVRARLESRHSEIVVATIGRFGSSSNAISVGRARKAELLREFARVEDRLPIHACAPGRLPIRPVPYLNHSTP